MRTIDEIRKNPQVVERELWANGHAGTVQLDGQQKEFIFVCTVDHDDSTGIEMEHVSVHITNSKKSMPTWKEMCKIKEIFWRDDEEVHQIHPKAENYLHGVGDLENVLHLWRPVGGWGRFEE